MPGFPARSAGTAQDNKAVTDTIRTRWAVLTISSSPQDGHCTIIPACAGCMLAQHAGHSLGFNASSNVGGDVTTFRTEKTRPNPKAQRAAPSPPNAE